MTIVVGYLMSDEGRAALDRAMQEAKLRDARLVVAHSLRGGPRDELERIERKLQAEPITSEVRELVRGRPAGEDLVGVATDEGAELLVIGLRRRNPVGKLALGSNARDVLLHARCPVLAVKAE